MLCTRSQPSRTNSCRARDDYHWQDLSWHLELGWPPTSANRHVCWQTAWPNLALNYWLHMSAQRSREIQIECYIRLREKGDLMRPLLTSVISHLNTLQLTSWPMESYNLYWETTKCALHRDFTIPSDPTKRDRTNVLCVYSYYFYTICTILPTFYQLYQWPKRIKTFLS